MTDRHSIAKIFIVSGSVGASAEQVVRTVLAQFSEETARIIIFRNVRQPGQIDEILDQARCEKCLVVYTLVDPLLHDYLFKEASRLGVQTMDLMGPLFEWIFQKTGERPRGEPGLYRQLNREYFDRVAAIDFTMAHDDGKNVEEYPQADMVLMGVSRVGKTPLSLYLAVLGYKVANYPFVPQFPVPDVLFSLDSRRVFGLTIEAGQLLQLRQRRQRQLGAPGPSDYINPEAVYEEIQESMKVFRRGHFSIIDMTDKTIEQGADEILRRLERSATAPYP